jgi:RimJ/RimL family protein N-acetyltransferase
MHIGNKATLTPLLDQDRELLFQWINDAELVRFNSAYRPTHEPNHAEWFTGFTGDPSQAVFAIRDAASAALVGLAQLVNIHPIHRCAELRIRIGSAEYRDQGFGGDALRQLRDFAWDDLNLERVYLHVFAGNARAIRAYEKAGFVEEGRMRRAAFIDGNWQDVVAMAVLRADCTPPDAAVADFTEAAYEGLLRLAIDRGYRFARYDDPAIGRYVLWRHDVDVSVHRAERLAAIEREHGIQATYFVDPHCQFYNMLEPGILAKLRNIRDLGHAIGLHFAANAYPAEGWTAALLAERLAAEKALLERFLECPITAFSYHLPEFGDMQRFDGDAIAGMVNAYGRSLRESCVYGSDSNGYWRYRPPADLIRSGKHERLQILTHPEWWTAEPMAPRARIERCVLGRARNTMRFYDDALARDGRLNLGKTDA